MEKQPQKAAEITKALSTHSGLSIKPRIGKSYPQILSAFETKDRNIVYVGSFVQAIIHARNLGIPLVQMINGKEFYSGVLVYPNGNDPAEILKTSPAKIAFAKGASSGESSAKAATDGKASIPTPNHQATCMAVKAGKASAGVVKNWWWNSNKAKFSDLAVYEIPEISTPKNPDNVLTASNAISSGDREKIVQAAIASTNAFGADQMIPFDSVQLDFSLGLMKKGGIDPLAYTW
jgi:ABC-type phosphate/phosphonate transport system substrate-binding protein